MGYYTEPKYKHAKDLEQKLEEFKAFYDCSETKKIPSKGKLDMFLGILPASRCQWKKDREDLAPLLINIELWIREITRELAWDNHKHAEWELSRAFGETEKQIIESTNTHTVQMPTVKIDNKELMFDVGGDDD